MDARSTSRFSGVAITLHWLIAVLMFANIWIAWQMEEAKGAELPFVYNTHKSLGLTIFFLALLRLAWRFSHRPPAYPPDMRRWEMAAASVVHWGFYAILIGMPLSGWIGSSTNAPEVPRQYFFGAFMIPLLPGFEQLSAGARKSVHDAAELTHYWLGWLTYGLIVLHVAAALKHQVLDRDIVLSRMLPLPFLRPRARPPRPDEIG